MQMQFVARKDVRIVVDVLEGHFDSGQAGLSARPTTRTRLKWVEWVEWF